MSNPYDAILVLSFGGPEKREDVIPFHANVLRGRNVPRERMLEVAEHYYEFGGHSPINDQNRALIEALKQELAANGPSLPIYWGNRNWHPMLPDTLRQMRSDGVKRALAFVTSAYSSYSGCRQYREDIAKARQEVGPGAPEVDKLRQFYDHPGFIGPMVENVKAAAEKAGGPPELVFTAHSVPMSMARTSRYVDQLEAASRLVAEGAGFELWKLVYQSRSGPPRPPWLEPDICDYLRQPDRAKDVIVIPIGFISDHMEVVFDLDTEAQEVAEEVGMNLVRAATVGVDPKFISMIRELIVERINKGPEWSVCEADCCPRPVRQPARPATGRPAP